MTIPELTLTGKKFSTYRDTSKKYLPSFQQFQAISERADIIRNIKPDQIKRSDVLSEQFIEAYHLYRSLPAPAKKQLRDNGKAQMGWWDEDTETFVAADTAPHSRGVMFIMKSIECNFTCAITGIKVDNIGYLQIDHIIPLTAGGTDHPSNWLIVDAKVNQYKNNYDLDWLIQRAEETVSAGEQVYLNRDNKSNTRIAKKNIHKDIINDWDPTDGLTLFNTYTARGLQSYLRYVARKYKVNQLGTKRPKRAGGDHGNYSQVVYALTRLVVEDLEDGKRLHKECQAKGKLYDAKIITNVDLVNYYADVVEYVKQKTGFSWEYTDRESFVSELLTYVKPLHETN